MSRGPGSAQRFVLDQVAKRPNELIALPVLAYLYASERGVEVTPHLRSSLRRAIARLYAEDEIVASELWVPTAIDQDGQWINNRWAVAVGHPDLEIYEEGFSIRSELIRNARAGCAIFL
jgi:hypothetical protein